MSASSKLLAQQIEYYRARAGEYDEWFLRRGRYDRGEELNRQWFVEVQKLVAALDEFSPSGRVLELACGTGLFTQHLVRHAASITAVDASQEEIEINRQRCQNFPVKYVQADIFGWMPHSKFDAAFFSFWLSHVPPKHFAEYWAKVHDSLNRGGRAMFIDSLYNPDSTARDHTLQGRDSVTSKRRLNDGREFEICKVFYDPEQLQNDLRILGWNATVNTTGQYFLFGIAEYTGQCTRSLVHRSRG
jgi:demethylmenaquinone methyltransferase/2-methoxy-6-polyprenyl-1,4-benzoquinol methylase